jgi:hypothetical protein
MDADWLLLLLNEKWGWELPFGWIPMTSELVIPDTEIYQSEPFEVIEAKVIELLKATFAADQLFEIEEGGRVEFKLLDDCVFSYDGLEHLYTNQEGDFMVYFSHEDSVTIGGEKLLTELHKVWPAYKSHFWIDGDTYKLLHKQQFNIC